MNLRKKQWLWLVGIGLAVTLAGCKPTIRFTGTPDEGTAPLEVTFTDESATLILGVDWSVLFPINDRQWSFGDGETSRNKETTHTYALSGNYKVSLTCTNAFGSSTLSYPDYIRATGNPSASFLVNVLQGEKPLEVKFTDTSSPGSYEILGWTWAFGDGTVSTEQNPTHTYSEAGTYSVTLTLNTTKGEVKVEKADYITVSEPEEE